MKKILSLFVSVLVLASCNDLELTPLGSLTGSNFPLTDNDAVAAVNGVYTANSELSSSWTYIGDAASDATQFGEAVTGDGEASLALLQYGPSNEVVAYVWDVLFQGITTANAAINNISASENISEPLKTRLVNEAKFLRGLYYFYAVQAWGDVPLILNSNEGICASRTDVDKVYEQIVKDLTDATGLPDASTLSGTDKGRASKGAAYTLLAKVNLTWGQTLGGDNAKFDAAVKAAEQVTGYELEEDFNANWSSSKRNGKENIFSAHHVLSQFALADGGNHWTHCAFATTFDDKTPHVAIADISFYNSFDDRDQRKKGSYAKKYTELSAQKVSTFAGTQQEWETKEFTLPRYRKAIDVENIETTNNNRDLDRTILRYADLLLLKAEAINERDHAPNAAAYDAINTVRRRAFNKEANPAAFDLKTGLTYEQFRNAVREERGFEFVYEQQRWFDLARWRILVKASQDAGKNAKSGDKSGSPAKAKNAELKHYHFPIPQSERNKNPEGLWQNWGYDGSTVKDNPYQQGFE
ncbi:SusD family protein [Bacteroidales bacterium Barb6]|nr:SusD family protein [Bacteroidales bacterium Barb6]